jgi:hypothetical protein
MAVLGMEPRSHHTRGELDRKGSDASLSHAVDLLLQHQEQLTPTVA